MSGKSVSHDDFIPDEADLLEKARTLAAYFALDAAERDKAGGAPLDQIARLKQSGLLKALIPQDYGGYGASWSTILKIVRLFAKVDGSLAHLYGYHFLVMNGSRMAGAEDLTERVQRATARNDLFWGNSISSLSPTLTGKLVGNEHHLNGFRPFSSGSHVADMLLVGWNDEESNQLVHAAIPVDRAGLNIRGDWDGFGQTQTGSGTVYFHNVIVRSEEVIDLNKTKGEPISTLLPQISQSILSSVFIGTAIGALEAARDYTMSKSRAWINSGVTAHHEDPWVQRVYGELWSRAEAALLLVEKADLALNAIWEAGRRLTAEDRAEHARIIALANIVSGEVGLKVTSDIFEVMGARSATRSNGFDRFWRNVRLHTLHNPAEYKARNIGLWFLTGKFPDPKLYV